MSHCCTAYLGFAYKSHNHLSANRPPSHCAGQRVLKGVQEKVSTMLRAICMHMRMQIDHMINPKGVSSAILNIE